MKYAVTGATGLVGRHLVTALSGSGASVVSIARGVDRRDTAVRQLPNTRFVFANVASDLGDALDGCQAVAHCAGINREKGAQSYRKIHLDGTRNVIEAAQRSGVARVILVSYLRARPDCGSAYLETKWESEEMLRSSGLDYTIVRPGLIFGPGDQLIGHLAPLLKLMPVFANVGFGPCPVRPLAVEDLIRVLQAALVGELPRRSVAVLGPEELPFAEVVRRIGRAVQRRPLIFPMPVWFHQVFSSTLERVMTTPLVATAQVRMLSEGMVEPLPAGICSPLPLPLEPALAMTVERIAKALPQS